jgi:hypothetical protein
VPRTTSWYDRAAAVRFASSVTSMRGYGTAIARPARCDVEARLPVGLVPPASSRSRSGIERIGWSPKPSARTNASSWAPLPRQWRPRSADRDAAVLLVDGMHVGELREEDPVRIGSLRESLWEPVYPGTRQLLHAKDSLRPCPAGRWHDMQSNDVASRSSWS